jgi:hypothetical protein
MSDEKNAGQSQNIKMGSQSFERLTKLKYLGTTLTD